MQFFFNNSPAAVGVASVSSVVVSVAGVCAIEVGTESRDAVGFWISVLIVEVATIQIENKYFLL